MTIINSSLAICQISNEKCICSLTNTNQIEMYCETKSEQIQMLDFDALTNLDQNLETYLSIKNKNYSKIKQTSKNNTLVPLISYLIINKNKIESIEKNSFQNFFNLKYLYLNENEISKLEHDSFAGLN